MTYIIYITLLLFQAMDVRKDGFVRVEDVNKVMDPNSNPKPIPSPSPNPNPNPTTNLDPNPNPNPYCDPGADSNERICGDMAPQAHTILTPPPSLRNTNPPLHRRICGIWAPCSGIRHKSSGQRLESVLLGLGLGLALGLGFIV